MIGVGDRADPSEFRIPRGVEDAPIRTDAAFESLPRLVEGLDDVVVDAKRIGAREEIADHRRLGEASRDGVTAIVAGARPAKFRDDDALSRIGLTQGVIDAHRLFDRGLFRQSLPIGQDVRGDEIDGGRQLRMLEPDVPDFARGDRHIGFAFHALDALDHFLDGLFAAEDRFVADHDAVDIALAAREIEHGARFTLVAVFVLVDPGADRDPQAELVGDRRDGFDAAGRGIGAHRPRVRGEQFQVGADIGNADAVTLIRMSRIQERRVGNA